MTLGYPHFPIFISLQKTHPSGMPETDDEVIDLTQPTSPPRAAAAAAPGPTRFIPLSPAQHAHVRALLHRFPLARARPAPPQGE